MEVRDEPTLCYLPNAVDELLQLLSIDLSAKWRGLSSTVVTHATLFRQRLYERVKARFSWVFDPSSVALSAALFCPGENKLKYTHFTISDADRKIILQNVTDDLFEVIPKQTEAQAKMLNATLLAVLELVDNSPAQSGSTLLHWWKETSDPYKCVLPLVKMLLAIPATSCENERSFRSAGLLFHAERTSLSVLHFQQEHRVQQFFAHNNDKLQAADYRKLRVQKAFDILDKLQASLETTETLTTTTVTTDKQ